MPYNKTNNKLFIHIPKVAGTSVINMYNMNENEGHVTSIQYRNNNAIRFKNAFKFAIVRNPWDKFVSCYEYAKMGKSYWHSVDGNSVYGKHIDYDLVSKYKFNDFIKYLKDIEGKFPMKSVNWSYQYNFVTDTDNNIIVDTLYNYEHLEYMVNDLNSKFNTNHKLPYINKSNNDNYKSYYNDESIEFINLLYKNDIVLFNYKFD